MILLYQLIKKTLMKKIIKKIDNIDFDEKSNFNTN